MKNRSARNGLLAVIALAAWALYILACTSFSPDDKKVLYPTFHTPSGVIGISVYDRESGKTEPLFLPLLVEKLEDAGPEPVLVRAQWMADGSAVLVSWPGTPENHDGDGINLALIPVEGGRTTKLFYLPDVDEPLMQLLRPPALAGNRLFTLGGSNHMVRLDLNTGEVRTHPYTGEMTLYSSAQGEHLLYFLEKKGEDDEKKIEFGRMNPDTFAQTSLMEFDDFDSEEGFLAIGLHEKSVATMVKDSGQYHLVVYRQGQSPHIRPLKDTSHKLHFGSAAFSLQGDVVYATYHRVEKAKEKGSFGLMEIPLANRPVRRTTLVSETDASETEMVLYLQLGLSHDGKTAAVATTYLAADGENIRPEDCALFLVDLSVPERKVTKIPVPLPKRPNSRND